MGEGVAGSGYSLRPAFLTGRPGAAPCYTPIRRLSIGEIMSSDAPEVTVTVDPPDAPPPPPDDAPDVVVVDTGDDNGSDDVALIVGELRARVESLEAELIAARNTAAVAVEEAHDVADAVDDAVEEIIDAIEETTEETEEPETVPDEEPVHKHWAHKSARELFGSHN